MSFIRPGHPLDYFKGESHSYVFPTSYKKNQRTIKYIEDYGDEYRDNATFAELLTRFVLFETKDKKYAWKIAKVLAKKLNVKLRPHKLTTKEYLREKNKLMKTDKKLKRMLKELYQKGVKK